MTTEAQALPPQEPPMNQTPPPRRSRWHADGESNAFSPRYKSPVLASFLSIVPGLGQVYVGYYQVGFLHVGVIISMIALLASDSLGNASPVAALFIPFFLLYNIIDAGRRAAYFNLSVQGMDEVPLPGDIPTAGSGGSTIFGVLLVAVGVIALSNTAFDFSLRWLEDWWPVAPIAIGAYLLYKSFADKASK